MMTELDRVVSVVLSSKKYHTVCADTIRRVAERELANHGEVKETIKATKRRLHQVYGAFEQETDYEALVQRLESAYRSGLKVEIEAACRFALGLHSSSRERLPILDRFYRSIFDRTGYPASILDLGCGLSPLALPWMDLPPGTQYMALDIDEERIRFLNRYLVLAGFEPLARCQDILVEPPAAADVALLLKMSPSLERQQPGATLELLEDLNASWIVISYAIKSLGGREKGMLDQYQRQFSELVADRQWSVEQLFFETELVFVVKRET
jgi:16S rRNA (guanine(1405)-N(7))-methyltransferase